MKFQCIAGGAEAMGDDSAERCSICDCKLHRAGEYARDTTKGRSHATMHHFVPERFFGRSKNRPGTLRSAIFSSCPWGHERKTLVYCYECHEELIHNPVLLPEDISLFRELVRSRGLTEDDKPEHRIKIAGRIKLFHEVIASGLRQLALNQNDSERSA
jgi:hypothetical protein